MRKVIVGCTKVIEGGLDEGRPLDRAFVRRGSAFGKLGIAPAIEDFGRAIALNPSLVEAYALRATAYKSLDKVSEALADLDMAISLSGREPKLFNEQGTVHRRSG